MQTTTSSNISIEEEEEEEEVTERQDLEMIEQMRTMEIMKKDSSALPALLDVMESSEEVEGEREGERGEEEATESFGNFETTTVIATSISTSEAISYYTSVSLPKSES